MSFVAKFTPAIRSAKGYWQLHCNIKPGASKSRAGISAVGENAIEICVAEQAKDGAANDAVVDIIRLALNRRRKEISIVTGWRSRVKTVTVVKSSKEEEQEEAGLERIRRLLVGATVTG